VKIARELFRLSHDHDGQLVLALVLLLGSRPGMTAQEVWESLGAPATLHPSIDHEWDSPQPVSRALGRLQRRGLVRGGPLDYGEQSVWRVTPKGLEWLGERLLFQPDERQARARRRGRS
jgi:hypothetical protein